MRKLIERYVRVPIPNEQFEQVSIALSGKRAGMPLALRSELPEVLSAIEIARLWVDDESTRAALAQAMIAAAQSGKLKPAGWYDHLIQPMPPKGKRETLPRGLDSRPEPSELHQPGRISRSGFHSFTEKSSPVG